MWVARSPGVPSLPRRVIGAAVDAAVILTVFGGAVGAAVWRSGTDAPDRRRRAWVLAGWSTRALAIVLRNRRTPGQWVCATRRVDARTGGPVSVRSFLTRQLFELALSRVGRRLMRRTEADQRRRHEEADRRVAEIRLRHGGDQEQILEETMGVYQELGVSCVPTLLAALSLAIVSLLLSLRSPRRQTPSERLSGTVVVCEPRR